MNSTDKKNLLKPDLKRQVRSPRQGEIIKVHQIIKEKGKERIQIFEGIVIAVKKPNSIEATFTVRKIAEGGIGVERIYPLYSTHIQKIEVVSKMHTRQAKLYYMRAEKKKRLRGTKKEEKAKKVKKERVAKKKTETKKDDVKATKEESKKEVKKTEEKKEEKK